jgi:hypothetical protein
MWLIRDMPLGIGPTALICQLFGLLKPLIPTYAIREMLSAKFSRGL